MYMYIFRSSMVHSAAKGRAGNSYPAWKTGPVLRVAEVPQAGPR